MSVVRALRGRIPDRWVRRWPTLRAVLVTYHVVAVVLLAFPTPSNVMSRSLWKEPTVQAELAAWASHLGVSRAGLEEALWGAAGRFLAVRRAALAPFSEYERYAGVEQSWRMFSAPNMFPARLSIDILAPGGWRTVYAGAPDERAWMRAAFADHSLRRAVFQGTWAKNKARYRMFCDWIARQAARDFPEASHVRVRHYRYRLPSPAEARAGVKELGGAYEDVEVRPLRRLRGGP